MAPTGCTLTGSAPWRDAGALLQAARGRGQARLVPAPGRDYEKAVTRAYDEPRLHFTLNCMSVGCPRLPREPFLPDALTQQMERETRFFFSESRNLRVDDSRRTVYVSEILSFYTEDFLAHAPGLIAYINRYVDRPLPADYDVRFIDYDWTVVRQPGDRS